MKGKTHRIGLARRILGDLLILAVLLLTADVTVVMLGRIQKVVLKADYRNIFAHELILCAVLLVFALDLRFGFFTKLRSRAGKALGWTCRILVTMAAAVILFFCGRVAVGGMICTAEPASHAIVLGMALQDGQPTRDLLARLDTARQYSEENPGAVLILTGGNPDESGRTEAQVMRELLVAQGVPEDRLLLEDQAATTKDNFRNTARMLDPGLPVVLISSDYHMDRAAATARSAGFTRVLRLPAPSEFLDYGANMLWEVILDLNELLK